MICVVVKFVCNDGKINDLLDILKSPDGLTVTRSYKGCKLVETSISEDGDTLYLYERWDSKEDHQAYLDFRVKDGLMEFLKPRLDGDIKVTYFSEE